MITIFGASDDTVVVEGDISEEFPWQKPGYGQASGDLFAFSDGTILRVEFTRDGVWRITPLVRGAGRLNIDQTSAGEGRTDRATLDGAVWVVQGITWAAAPPAREF